MEFGNKLNELKRWEKLLQENRKEKFFEVLKKYLRLGSDVRSTTKWLHREFMMMKTIKSYSEQEEITIHGISKSAVSQLINKLEDKNYVERTTFKSDRRIVYVRLTEFGEGVLEKNTREIRGLLF